MPLATRKLLLAGAIACVPGFFAACGKSGGSPTTQKAGVAIKPVPVTVVPARSDSVQRTVHVVGGLAAYEKANISNRVTGTVAKIYVDVGDRVKPSDKLLEIESTRFSLAVEQAQQQYAETLARLGFSTLRGAEVLDDTAPVRRARTELETARLKLEKAQPLYEQKLMKEFEYTDIANAVKVAESNLQSARDVARALVAQARGLQALIDLKKKDLADTTITAPDGKAGDGKILDTYVVTSRATSAGEYLREGSVLFTLMADQYLKLQARVPERYLAQIAKGNAVPFEVEAYPGRKFEGTITVIDPAIDPANRTFMIEATVDNKAGDLRPGSFVQGDIQIAREPGVVFVPVRAIASFVGENKVYVVEGQGEKARVRAVKVEMGQQVGDAMEILKDAKTGKAPVTAGDSVVISGITKLAEGLPVIVTVPATAPGTSSAPADVN